MRWIASLTMLLALATALYAAGPDDQYLDIYNQILHADALAQSGHSEAAVIQYSQADDALQKLHQEHPSWNPEIISFRLAYLANKLKALGKYLPAPQAAAVPTPLPSAPVAANPSSLPSASTPAPELAALRDQVATLTAANTALENKLHEALSVQPAAADPRELAKANEKILALQKESDLLNVALAAAKSSHTAPAKKSASDADAARLADQLSLLKTRSSVEAQAAQAEIARLTQAKTEADQKLAAANHELTALKSAPPAQPATQDTAQIAADRDRLKTELAAVSRELADREAHPNPLPATAKLKEVEQERDDLKKQLAAVSQPVVTPAAPDAAAPSAELERLRARLAVLQANPVPYTPEELAILHAPSATPMTAPPAATATAATATAATATAEARPTVHRLKDLPPGAGSLLADALRSAMARDYDHAEKAYREVLAQDPDNIYVLVHLANTQYSSGHLEDCEKNVQRSLTLDPDDPGALYLLGILRYRQDKLDDALDALSRSAKYNPTNAVTQNYLGCVLADKGLRPAAETALRKALSLEPDYADAHFNLAFVYARETPPFLGLARWHYQKALDLGHAKNAPLEKILGLEK